MKKAAIQAIKDERNELKNNIRKTDEEVQNLETQLKACETYQDLKELISHLIRTLWCSGTTIPDYKHKGICFKAYEDALHMLTYNKELLKKHNQSFYIRGLFKDLYNRMRLMEQKLNSSQLKDIDKKLDMIEQANGFNWNSLESYLDDDYE